MIKNRYRQFFSFFLITAFLSLQWSSAHIHLAEQHDHDSGQHQHSVTAHNHQSTSSHTDAIDIAAESVSHDDVHTVVELDQICTLFNGKHVDQSPLILSSLGGIFYRAYFSKYSPKTEIRVSYNSYLETTSVRLRAPPYFS